MKVTVTITLDVPDDFHGAGPWNMQQSLDSYVSHWLEEGYYIQDYVVELPSDIKYKGYNIQFPKEWGAK
jgi:hypothetical protein